MRKGEVIGIKVLIRMSNTQPQVFGPGREIQVMPVNFKFQIDPHFASIQSLKSLDEKSSRFKKT